MDLQEHWEKVYDTKLLTEVSWYQPVPTLSLELIAELNLAKDANIIDVGGGDSFLVDSLLDLGYTNITILDISAKALERAKQRLGVRATAVNWIVADAGAFVPEHKYDLWHDRAAFHFLRSTEEIQHYSNAVKQSLNSGGQLIIATFSTDGPLKCSGLEISQYSADTLATVFGLELSLQRSFTTKHPTPFGTEQDFVFGVFGRRI